MTTVRRRHFVLVHGAWHDASQWDAVRTELTDARTSAVELASSGDAVARLGDMYTDAGIVRKHVRLVRQHDPLTHLTVVAHSYGGIPAVQGLASGLEEPGVDELVLVGAFLLDIGESLRSAAGPAMPFWWQVDQRRDVIDPTEPRKVFYGDLPSPAAAAAVSRLHHQRFSSFRQPLTRAAWRSVPTSYIVLDRDAAIPPSAQEAMAARAARVSHLDAAHAPFLSKPRELAALLARAPLR